MIPANPISAPNSSPLPPNLISSLPQRKTPWNVSSSLFDRIKAQSFNQPFKLCEVLNSDPEFNFILKYFEHQKPVGYSIKRIVCIHNPDHTQMFESTFKNMEREATNPVFSPKGKEEDPKIERARVITRWEQQAAQFSPVEIKSSHSREADSCSNAKVLPLWHGSSEFVCQSVCSSGFTYFGKQHYFDEAANKGSSKSTDKGYFGSGIYFTNSARYAAMYSSEGHLLLSWVSMREPYPIVNDKPHPQKGSDMIKLEGQKHYQNYNAHFIPVTSIDPNNPKCINYYPCYRDQLPAWDEFVVFEKSQTLPRFWIELGVDFPNVVLSELANAGELLTLILTLLDKEEIQNHAVLSEVLQTKAGQLLDLPELTPLGAEDQKFLKLAKRLMPEGQKMSPSTLNMLLKSISTNPLPIASPLPQMAFPTPIIATPPKSPALSVVSISAALPSTPSKPTLPAIAFGKEKWATCLGDVGEEPPLPSDIEKILKSPCPFFPGKKVEETHLLTLIPQTVNGKPLTLNSLEELVKHPQKGYATQYIYHLSEIKNEYGEKPLQRSYWALMTQDVIPESRAKSYEIQAKLLKELSQKAQVPYEIPQLLEAATSILMKYLQTGKRLYSNSPWTYTRCQERVSSNPNWPLAVGAFTAGGSLAFLRPPTDSEGSGIGGVSTLNMLLKSISTNPLPIASPLPQVAFPTPIIATPPKPPELPVASVSAALPSTLSKPTLPAIAFGKEKWATYLGDVGEEPPLPPAIVKILQSSCPFFEGKRVEETHFLTLIPKTVNGRPLTLDYLEELIKHPKKGSSSHYKSFSILIRNKFGNTPIKNSYWVLLTTDIIPNTRNRSYNIQKGLLEKCNIENIVNYRVPRILEIAACLFMEYLRKEKRFYSDTFPWWTYSRCEEIFYDSTYKYTAVGGFMSDGLCILEDDSDVNNVNGMAGIRRF